jgi:hypothetical protein
MTKGTQMRGKKSGETVGMTLRVSVEVRDAYSRIADRANLIAIRHGGHANTTVQDVMRHRLNSLPFVQIHAEQSKKKTNETEEGE